MFPHMKTVATKFFFKEACNSDNKWTRNIISSIKYHKLIILSTILNKLTNCFMGKISHSEHTLQVYTKKIKVDRELLI
jgi:hypothetical protein